MTLLIITPIRGVRYGIRLSLFGPLCLHSVRQPAKFPSEIGICRDDVRSRPEVTFAVLDSRIGNGIRDASTAQEAAEQQAPGSASRPCPFGFVLPQRRRGRAVLRRQRPLPACGGFRLPALGERLVIRGKSCTLGLGSCRLVSLAEARERALTNRKIARSGGDPLADRRRANGAPTFAEVAEKVIAIHSEIWKQPGKTRRQWQACLRDHAYSPHR